MKRIWIFIVVISLIAMFPALPGFAEQAAPQAAAPAAPQVEKPWPRSYNTASGASFTIYQPQAASWDDQKHMVAYAAVSYIPSGEIEKPELGTLKIEADTQVSLAERLVKFSVLKITEASFPSLVKEQIRGIVSEVEKTIPDQDRIIGLDRVLASLDKSKIIPKNVPGIKAEPPQIFFSKTPAILLNIDGEPIWSPIRENDLKFAVNTNWDLFQYGPTGAYYLRNDTTWLQASDVKGPWVAAEKLPSSFNKLPDEENWKEVKANLKGKHAGHVPTVFVSTQPAELIALQGEPKYFLVSGADTKLMWVSNTESDLFRMGEDGPVYYLVAGRWFSAPDFSGPWTFATPSLPPDFKMIPLEHARSRVLAAVPGTAQAAEAVLLAQIPQTARVNKKELKAPEVVYNGNPEFKPIETTSLARAINTDKEVIKVADLYYMCFDGIWFMGSSPTGPWTVASSVPGEIYEIPVSSPAHNVTYVTVKDEDKDDEWVEYAAMAGYWGMMTAWGCEWWGSGWYYDPYYGYSGGYPIYYPPLRTYGYGSWYNPRTGFYGSAGRIYGPYGGVGFGARYNPTTGTYARGAMAWGPNGARGAAQVWNPRTGTYAATRQGSGVYGSWGSTYVQRGDQWAQTKRFTSERTGNTTRVTRTDEGAMIRRKGEEGSGFVGKGQENVYAGRDGNVYRRDESGNWSKWENGGWNDVQRPSEGTPKDRNKAQMDRSTYKQLERDRAARLEGSKRTSDFSNYKKSKGSSNVGSYRGYSSGGFSRGYGGGGFSRGGGGFRGGGGRRR